MNIKVDPSDRIARPRSKNTPFIVALAITTVIAGFIGLWAYNQHQEKLALQERIAEIDRQLEEQNRLESEARRKLAGTITNQTPHYDEVTREWERRNGQMERSTARPAVTQQRQTVFNDDNYTPKQITNTVPPPSQRHFEKRPANPPAQRIQKRAPWVWESYTTGGRKKKTGGQFLYFVQGGQVDTASICQNETYGSIRYRDCRKAAKKYFSEQCRKGSREACTGENMIP